MADVADHRRVATDLLSEAFGGADHGRDFERAVYNHTIHICKYNCTPCNWDNPAFLDNYVSRVMYVARNAASMTEAKARLSATSSEVICMKPSELRPDIWEELVEKKNARKELYGIKPKANTWSFRCKNCKNNECSYYEMQTRSADEPMTMFVLCLTCGNRWRMG